MKDIKGISIVFSKKFKYAGKFIDGLWFDHNEKYDLPEEKRTGWGVKFDLTFGYIIRPVKNIFNLFSWFSDKKIRDVENFETEFGTKVESKVKALYEIDSYVGKYKVYNPWFGHRLFVLRLPKWIPTFFISLSFGKYLNIYLGFKTYEVDTFPPNKNSSGWDYSWTNKKDNDRACKDYPLGIYNALCPSMTIRTNGR